MVNEVALVLLVGLFGWKVALIYVATGLTIAILSGWLIGKLKMEKYVADWVYSVKANAEALKKKNFRLATVFRKDLILYARLLAKFGFYIIIGIAVGAGSTRLCPRRFPWLTSRKRKLVRCSAGHFNGSSYVFQCCGHYSYCKCTHRKRSVAWNGTGIYDVGNCLVTPRNYHPEEGFKVAINCCICGHCCFRNCNRRFHF